jgi:hypothetical protein
MFTRGPRGPSGSSDPGQSPKGPSILNQDMKLGMCLVGMALAAPAALQAIDAGLWPEGSTFKGIKNNVAGAVRCIVSLLPVQDELNSAFLTDLAQQGMEHKLRYELDSLAAELEAHFGKRYLEHPPFPGEEISREKKLYAACLEMLGALQAKDGDRIALGRITLNAAINLHREN